MNFATVLRFMLEAKGSLVDKVRITPDGESTSAAISDEGPGISADTPKGFHSGTRLTGVGMMGMRERIKSCADGSIFDLTEGGTRIDVRVPLHAHGKAASA